MSHVLSRFRSQETPLVHRCFGSETLTPELQHYTDGDTVNNKTPIGLGPAGSESLAVWGPELPQDFLD